MQLAAPGKSAALALEFRGATYWFVIYRYADGAVEERSALFEALQDLPPVQRRTVVLRHWLGLSIGETAQELGVSEGAVKSNSSRGLAKLKEALGSEHRA